MYSRRGRNAGRLTNAGRVITETLCGKSQQKADDKGEVRKISRYLNQEEKMARIAKQKTVEEVD